MMKIYNYLFYKSYILAKRSKNFEDMPTLGGIMFVVACVMFNIFTIVIFLEGVGFFDDYPFQKKYKYPFSVLLVLIILFYYHHNKRYEKIIEKYEICYSGKSQIHPVFVIVLYYLFSFGLLLLSGLYKNRDWIFSNIR